MNKMIEIHLIQDGIKNLKEFGYPFVNDSNIFTDYIYSKMFLSMLKETKEESNNSQGIVTACDALIARINEPAAKS